MLSWQLHKNYFMYYFCKVFHICHNCQTHKSFNMMDCDLTELLVDSRVIVAKLIKKFLELQDGCGCLRGANGGYCSQQFQ